MEIKQKKKCHVYLEYTQQLCSKQASSLDVMRISKKNPWFPGIFSSSKMKGTTWEIESKPVN